MITNLATIKFNSKTFSELPWTKSWCQNFTGKEQGKYEYEKYKIILQGFIIYLCSTGGIINGNLKIFKK